MMTLRVRNVNDAFTMGLWWLNERGEDEHSRVGRVRVFPGPITTIYSNPQERVLFDPERDANPFFHLAECIWILAGSSNLAWIQYYNQNMADFSDDGKTLNGAYGYRLRDHFGYDQLVKAIEMLQKNPKDRRVVMTMWDPFTDLGSQSVDIPCNTQIYLRIIKNELDMMVTCRSNDVIWGAYGTNAVHFSFLQEFIAWAVGVNIGRLYQTSWNYHIYERHWPLLKRNSMRNEDNPYTKHEVIPLVDEKESYRSFLLDCENLVEFGTSCQPISDFLRFVFLPMMKAWEARKNGKDPNVYLDEMPKCDWRAACKAWIARRINHVS